MMRALALPLLLLAAPAAAVELDCTLERRCLSPDGCEDLAPDRPDARARLSIDPTTHALTVLTYGTPLRLDPLGNPAGLSPPGTTWAAVDADTRAAMMLTLRPDLDFSLSAHILQEGELVATAGHGSCVEVAP